MRNVLARVGKTRSDTVAAAINLVPVQPARAHAEAVANSLEKEFHAPALDGAELCLDMWLFSGPGGRTLGWARKR